MHLQREGPKANCDDLNAMNRGTVWEKIPNNVKQDLTPPRQLKHAPVIHVCSKIGSVGSDCGRLVVTDGLDRQPTLLCSLFLEGAGRERTGLQCYR
ncbi:MAG: hypothetical protein OJF51_001004 [Nitrospira sp.]|jgi:hypothetical protein|nr:MAG: hypothetical protein OJF51_001004 [Nitrospira sp.]